MIGSSNTSTWVLETTIGISIGSMGNSKVWRTITSSTPPLMGLGFSVVVTSSFRKLVATIIDHTSELFWKNYRYFNKFNNELVIHVALRM
jgi:hypothetical protein